MNPIKSQSPPPTPVVEIPPSEKKVNFAPPPTSHKETQSKGKVILNERIGREKKIQISSEIEQLSKEGNAAGIREKFDVLKSLGQEPDLSNYYHLVLAYFESGNPDEGMKVFDEMAKKNMKFDRFFVNDILDLLCKKGNYPSVVQFINKMPSFGIEPDLGTYERQMKACGNFNELDEIGAIFETLGDKNIELTATTFEMAICAHLKNKKGVQALKIFDEIKRIYSTPSIYEHLIGYFAKRLNSKAHGLFTEMKTKEVCPTAATLCSMVVYYASTDNISEAVKLHKGINFKTTEVYNALIAYSVRNNHRDKAYDWFVSMKRNHAPFNQDTIDCLLKGNHISLTEKAKRLLSFCRTPFSEGLIKMIITVYLKQEKESELDHLCAISGKEERSFKKLVSACKRAMNVATLNAPDHQPAPKVPPGFAPLPEKASEAATPAKELTVQTRAICALSENLLSAINGNYTPTYEELVEFIIKATPEFYRIQFDHLCSFGVPVGDASILEFLKQGDIDRAIETYDYMMTKEFPLQPETLWNFTEALILKKKNEKLQEVLASHEMDIQDLLEYQIENWKLENAMKTLEFISQTKSCISLDNMLQLQEAYLSFSPIDAFEAVLHQIIDLQVFKDLDAYIQANLQNEGYDVAFAAMSLLKEKRIFPTKEQCEAYIAHFTTLGMIKEAFGVYELTSNGRKLDTNLYTDMLNLVDPSWLD